MRVLLVVCLLVGSISSLPVWKEQGGSVPGNMLGPYTTSTQGSDQGSSSSLNPANPSYVSGAGVYATGYDGSGGSYGAGYGAGSSGGAGYGAGSHGGAGWSSGSTSYEAVGDEDAGPFFSDVSDLDPIYMFSSRSRYQRGRAVFAQSRYTPGEPLVEPMPRYVPVIKNPVILEIPVQEPVKQQVKQTQVKPQTQQGYVQQGY